MLAVYVNNHVTQDSRLVNWDLVCSQVLGRQLHVWTLFASEVFIGRVEVKLTDRCLTGCAKHHCHINPLTP